MEIIEKIKIANLVGRGGASFPVATKWASVAKAMEAKENQKCYVVCNASEGEPGVKKDLFILENYPEKMIEGMNIAIEFIGAEKGYIYLNPKYYDKLGRKLAKSIKGTKIELFKKDHLAGYAGGEESTLVNHLEGKRIEPRLRPPFVASVGLWDCPTIVNNVETFYDISLVAIDKYEKKRFYTIGGDCLNSGVYNYPNEWTIEKILRETNNYPKFEFFVQVGGDASGEVLNSGQLDRPASGAGSITIYSLIKHKPEDLMRKWAYFFCNESCGQCTPCREGTYRLREIFERKVIDWQLVNELLDNLEQTSFCGLGLAVPVPFKTYLNNVYKNYAGN